VPLNSIDGHTRGTKWVSSRSREILEIISSAAVPVLISARLPTVPSFLLVLLMIYEHLQAKSGSLV